MCWPLSVAALQSSPVVEEKVKPGAASALLRGALGVPWGSGESVRPVVLNYRCRAGPRPAFRSGVTDHGVWMWRLEAMERRQWAGPGFPSQPQTRWWCRGPAQQASTLLSDETLGLARWTRPGRAGDVCSGVTRSWTHSRSQYWAQSPLCDRDPCGQLDLCRRCDSLGLRLLKWPSFGRVWAAGGQCPTSAQGTVDPAARGYVRSRERR